MRSSGRPDCGMTAGMAEHHISAIGDDGSVWLDHDVAARVLSTVPLADLRLALINHTPVLVCGDPPIVIGVIRGQATVPPGRQVVEAARELVLRCGAGSISIAADGTVQIRGSDIRSSARRLQRITGAQVKIN